MNPDFMTINLYDSKFLDPSIILPKYCCGIFCHSLANKEKLASKQQCIEMQLKCSSRHYPWASSMTPSIDSDTRHSIAWCSTAGTIDDPIDGRLGCTIDDPIDGRQHKRMNCLGRAFSIFLESFAFRLLP